MSIGHCTVDIARDGKESSSRRGKELEENGFGVVLGKKGAALALGWLGLREAGGVFSEGVFLGKQIG